VEIGFGGRSGDLGGGGEMAKEEDESLEQYMESK
jgi:hypothetical protein